MNAEFLQLLDETGETCMLSVRMLFYFKQ